MIAAPESAMVVSFIGAFFNVLRFAVDVITMASKSGGKHKEKESLDKSNHSSTSSSIKSPAVFDGRLTLTNTRLSMLRKSKKQKQNENAAANTTNANESVQNDSDEEGGTPEIEVERSPAEKLLSLLSVLFQLSGFIFLLVITVLNAQGNSSDSINDARYSAICLGASTVGLFFGLWVAVRDYNRQRFNTAQRLFYVMSTAITMLGNIVLVADLADPPDTTMGSTNVDYIVMACLIVYFFLSLIEARVFEFPKSKDSAETTEKKAHLGKALLLILKPYFWPDATSSSAFLNRFRAIFTWVCVIGSKACSLTSPIFLGKASTALAKFDYPESAKNVLIFCAIQFCATFLKECQSLVYLKVAQAAFIQLSEVAFFHLHSLSLDWHLRKKLGEVIRSMDRGILACDILMKYLFLWMIPAIAECLLVCIIFATYFDYLPLALVIFTFVFVYMTWTVVVTLWRKKFRKDVAKSDNDWHDKCTDSLINFETVKYFTAEKYEIERFSDSIKEFQTSTVNVQASLSFLNISQALLMQTCLAAALVLSTYGIKLRFDCCLDNGCVQDGLISCCSDKGDVCGGLEVGDFVTVLTYTLNLFGPLNFLGSVYNAIVMAMVDLRNLSELLAEEPDLQDAPDATILPEKNASDADVAVEFDNVSFRYPTQGDGQGLSGVSFKMMRGTTTAIVGQTGAGKTTISRLLFRFYDVTGGAVKVNGTDVRTVTQTSLRESIGVVPQATSMFNDTLKANILYGRRDATDEELDNVAQAAQLINFIRTLPDGWETMVGDRGLKLSGGEQQRASIARCLLKNPPFVVLDEGTFSVINFYFLEIEPISFRIMLTNYFFFLMRSYLCLGYTHRELNPAST